MKRTLKRILILSFVAALVLVAVRLISLRRSGARLPAQPWVPPASSQPVHVEVHVSEPPSAAPEAAPRAVEASEPAVSPPAVPEEAPPAVTEPITSAAAEDTAPERLAESPATSHLHVVEPEELRLTAIEPSRQQPEPVETPPAEEPDLLTSYFNKFAETSDEDLVQHLATMAEPGLELEQEQVPPPAPEPVAPPEPEPSAETAAELPRGPEPLAAEPTAELPRADEPALEAAPAPETAEDVQLPESLEEALSDLAPVPIVPPPRRTAESYLDEGNVYFNVSQYGLAIDRYSTAIEMDPELVAAYYNRANARTRGGDFEAALADYDKALVLQPFDADALNNRGMLHLYRANYDEALRDFNAALVIDPADTTVMVNRGLAYLHRGDAAAALVDFQEAASLDTEDSAAAYGAGQAAAVMGNREEALRHIGRAISLNPGYAREAAADPNLALLQGDATFLKLLRESGSQLH